MAFKKALVKTYIKQSIDSSSLDKRFDFLITFKSYRAGKLFSGNYV